MISITTAKVKRVNAQYEYLKVKAPNDGLVMKKSIKAGEMAMPGMPAIIFNWFINVISKADISETNLNDLKIGQK